MPALAVVSRSTDHDADDLDLVAGVRAGDDRAFETLYLRYQGRITAYVRGMVHDHGRAEDITQEVFMSALRRMRGTDATIAFKPWIYEIAKNACIDAWRRSRNTNEVSFDAQDGLGADDHGRLADPGLTPASAVDNKDALDNLCGAFGGLSQTHHEILVMREFEGLSYREIGERLGMSRPGVESTLFRARKRLGEEYEELVSGERCLRVQRIIDSPAGRATGLRDQRRMARHLSHCQPCRRYARLAGVDLQTPERPAAAGAAKIAAWAPLPLPVFLRRRWDGQEAVVAQSHHGPVAQWSASLAGALDPATVSGWSKAIATAATVAVAGVGAGAAIREHRAIENFVGGSAPPAGHALPHGPAAGSAVGGPQTAARHAAPSGMRAPGDAAAGNPGPAGATLPVLARENASSGVTAPGAAGVTMAGSSKPDRADLGPAENVAAAPGADRPGAAALSDTPATVPDPSLGRALDALGAGAGAGAGPTGSTGTAGDATDATAVPGAGAPPQAPLVDGLRGQAGDVVGGTLPAPAALPAPGAGSEAKPAFAAPATLHAAATDVAGTVSTTVTSTLATTITGRSAP
jgi:RNA polymerase sigma factor (sigma-70 family)